MYKVALFMVLVVVLAVFMPVLQRSSMDGFIDVYDFHLVAFVKADDDPFDSSANRLLFGTGQNAFTLGTEGGDFNHGCVIVPRLCSVSMEGMSSLVPCRVSIACPFSMAGAKTVTMYIRASGYYFFYRSFTSRSGYNLYVYNATFYWYNDGFLRFAAPPAWNGNNAVFLDGGMYGATGVCVYQDGANFITSSSGVSVASVSRSRVNVTTLLGVYTITLDSTWANRLVYGCRIRMTDSTIISNLNANTFKNATLSEFVVLFHRFREPVVIGSGGATFRYNVYFVIRG